MRVTDQPVESLGLVEVQPVVDGVRIPGLQQSVPGDRVRGVAVGHLEQGGAPLPDIGPGVVVAVVGQRLPLALGQG
jgi:hypothetical protein